MANIQMIEPRRSATGNPTRVHAAAEVPGATVRARLTDIIGV